MSRYRTLGECHGTAVFYDASKPDTDAFLAHMEEWLPEHGREEYMEGFYDAVQGEKRMEYGCMRGLSKMGSDAIGRRVMNEQEIGKPLEEI